MDYYYQEGVKQKLSGNFTAAFDLFTHCHTICPKAPAPLYELGLTAYYLGQDEQGLHLIEQACELDPQNAWYLETLSSAYTEAHDLARATEVIERLAQIKPRRTDLLMQLADLYRRQQQPERCIDALERVELQLPCEVSVALLLSSEYMAVDRNDDALRELERAARLEPDNPDLLMMRLERLRYLGQDSLCRAMRDSLIFAEGTPSAVRMPLLGAMVKEQGLSEEQTADLLRDVLRIDPSNLTALSRLLPYYIENQRWEDAIEICHLGIDAFPDEASFPYFLGTTHFMTGNTEQAVEAYRSALSLVDQQSDPLMVSQICGVIADCLHDKGEADEAFALYERAIDANPQNAAALNNYSYYLSLCERDLERAEQMAYRAVKLEPLNRTYLDTYAWVLHVMGNEAMARFYISRAVSPAMTDEALLADPSMRQEMLQHAAVIYRACNMTDEADRYERLAKLKDDEE